MLRMGVRSSATARAEAFEPTPTPTPGLATGSGGAGMSPVQACNEARSRQRWDSSAEAITSVVAEGPAWPAIRRDDQRGAAGVAAREFDTHPSTRAIISGGVTIIPAGPSYRSR